MHTECTPGLGVSSSLNGFGVHPSCQVTEAAGVITFSLMDEEKRKLDAINADQRCVVPPFMSFADPEEGGAIKPSAVLGY